VKTLQFVLAAMVLSVANSNGVVVIYDFHPIITNAVPGVQAPQVEATFTDINPGKVLLTITTSDLTSGEFLSDLYFNFDPADNVKRLYFSRLGSPSLPAVSKIFTGQNSVLADGDGYYDIHLKFIKASKGRYFDNGCVTYQIVEPGLDASDFAFLDTLGSGTGSYYVLARVRKICGDSEWLVCSSIQPPRPAPEPASIVLFACAIGTLRCLYLRGKCMKQTRSPS
jgi:hypothetical protein